MSQRNPMNDRYQSDERKGKTRKSAASAKPKTKAASSVRVQSATKTPKQKKAVRKAENAKRRQVESKYYTPPTAEFKKWRRIWWILLIEAVVMTGLSFLVRMWVPENESLSLGVLGLGYIGIIGALILDFTKIRKLRREYQAEMLGKVSKEERAVEKKEHAQALAEKKAAAEEREKKNEDASPVEKVERKGLFSFAGLKGSAKRAAASNKAAQREQSQKKNDDQKSEKGE